MKNNKQQTNNNKQQSNKKYQDAFVTTVTNYENCLTPPLHEGPTTAMERHNGGRAFLDQGGGAQSNAYD